MLKASALATRFRLTVTNDLWRAYLPSSIFIELRNGRMTLPAINFVRFRSVPGPCGALIA